jgi:hypothetical protein
MSASVIAGVLLLIALEGVIIGYALVSTDRERRLWALSLGVVVAIYSTLGLARTFAEILNDNGLFGVGFFLVGCLLVLAAVVTQGLRTLPGRAEVGVALGIAAVYILVFVRMAIPTERSHIVEYGVVAAFTYAALTERASQGRRAPMPALFAIGVTGLVGAIDECIQAFIPSRVFDPLDMLFNVAAGASAVLSILALSGARRRWGKSN